LFTLTDFIKAIPILLHPCIMNCFHSIKIQSLMILLWILLLQTSQKVYYVYLI